MRLLKIVLLLSAMIAVGCKSRNQTEAPSAIKEYYAKHDTFLLKKDVRALTDLMREYTTVDYALILKPKKDNPGKLRKMTTQDLIQNLDEVMAIVDTVMGAVTNIDHVAASESSILATVSEREALATFKGKQSGKRHEYLSLTIREDAWIKVRGYWRLQSSRVLSRHRSINGRSLSED